MALEDAVAIADMIDQHDDVEDAFRAYEAARYLRTTRIQLTSRHFGEIYHATGAQRDLRNHLLAKAPPSALYDALGWVFSGNNAVF